MKIWTDGGCIGNGQADAVGAWAFVSEDGHEESGRLENTTNNRAELRAIIEGIRHAYTKKVAKLTVYTDSMLCVNCGMGRWKRKANLDLWNDFDNIVTASKLYNGALIRLEWVKGHSGVPQNERADELCSIAMGMGELSSEDAHLRSIMRGE